MSATITIAKALSTEKVIHINLVDKQAQDKYICTGCGQQLIPVKTVARKKDWHFRHPQYSDIAKCRITALHDLAVQILMDKTTVTLSRNLQINYSSQRKSAWINDKYISDVTVNYLENDVHFEIYVTHDLDKEKMDSYKTGKIKCVRIDLSDPSLRSAQPERIEDEVLNQYYNKKIIYWEDESINIQQPAKNWIKLEHIILVILAFFGLKYFFRRKRRRKQF